MHRIGIMQGRLLPKVGDRIQAFPGENWADEFSLAAGIGYDTIELTIETASYDIHPVRSKTGRRRLSNVVRETGVELAGLCCDVFMERPLTDGDADLRSTAQDMLFELLRDCGEIGLPMIELPMMGANSLRDVDARGRGRAAVEAALPLAEQAGVTIVLESDLPPTELAGLMDSIDHPRAGINYDMGNSTWFGYRPEDELPLYHRHVRNVHVKDCTVKDYSVPLGQGETSFDLVFELLETHGYKDGFVLQAARQDDDLAAGQAYLHFTRDLVAKWLA